MPKQNFVAGTTPTIGAVWLNKLDTLFVDAFAEAQTAAGVRSALGATTVGDGVFRAASAAAARTVLELAAGLAGDIWVKKAGDTSIGDQAIIKSNALFTISSNPSGSAAAVINSSVNSDSLVRLQSAVTDRFIIAKTGAESGGNTGANLEIFRYDDAGVFLSTPVSINRATGLITIAHPIVWSPGASVTPASNGQITIEFTNNTTLTFKAKGSDGTVRAIDAQLGVWKTFTPTVTLVGGAGNTVPVYSQNIGRYYKIGTFVHVEVLLIDDGGAEGAGSGAINIALPIVSSSAIGDKYGIPCGRANNGGTAFLLSYYLPASSSTFQVLKWPTISSLSSLLGSDQDNTARTIVLEFSYETNS